MHQTNRSRGAFLDPGAILGRSSWIGLVPTDQGLGVILIEIIIYVLPLKFVIGVL